ncbi:EAL domain-containing response regulator [Salinarimonas rosea]|uniref:EAL domain-containing response regulator n=1 Tax=Salinarimonas rosea TaxID=552063 RepID=UPI0003F6C43B|nr:EAL domain-containing protein [Salinarimonas rosea]
MPLIIILDDRVTNRNIFSRLAASIAEGVEVEAFGDPAEALQRLAARTPDLVITDFKMPTMTGAEFTRRFRRLPGCEDVPVIAITVYEERSFRLEALEAGATDFLLSPVDHAEFLTRARNLLQMRRQAQIIKSRASFLERELEDSERSREALLRDSRQRLAQVIDTVPALISAHDRDGACIFLNAHMSAFAAIDQAEAIGRPASDLIGAERAQRSLALDQLVFRSARALPSYEEEVTDRDGARHAFVVTKSPLSDADGHVIAVLTTALDITDRKKAESHLVHLAHHDALTGLANRTLLQDRMRREIARARRGDRFFALHLVDLDRFKSVNDALGHHRGDELLRTVAERLRHIVRDTDTVARLGGDEYAVLQTDVRNADEARDFARRLIAAIGNPFRIAGEDIVVGASLGVVLYPGDGEDTDDLIKNADIAMYRAKAEERNALRFFSADMVTAAREGITLETDLRRAIANREFELHYQPQIDLRTGRIVGAEALVRWRHPKRGLVRPLDFLPFAEETGIIIPINEWVMREACREAKSWQTMGLPRLRVGVNLSPIQFRKLAMRDLVLDVLSESTLDPELLDLEITETILMQNAEAVAAELSELRKLGVTFSIDDFGTGYSSLAYVKKFPVDRLKIDQGFVRNMKNDPNDAAIVRAIVNLGHSLGIETIAEGVDSPEQVGLLRAEGCDEAQGYLFSKPVPAAEFVALVRESATMRLSA